MKSHTIKGNLNKNRNRFLEANFHRELLIGNERKKKEQKEII